MLSSRLINIIGLVVLCQLIFISFTDGHNNTRHRRDQETLTIKYERDGVINTVTLRETDQLLAGVITPVWIGRPIGNRNLLQYELNQEVMNNIGVFTLYHGVNSHSAIVLFHECNTLHGVIDYDLFLENLPLRDRDDPAKSMEFMYPVPPLFSDLNKWKREISIEDFKNKSFIPDSDNGPAKSRLRRDNNEIVYPEILVAIDAASRAIENEEELRTTEEAVMYALTYWNAVDMLYSQLPGTRVKINIAGFIIEDHEGEFPFMVYDRNREIGDDYPIVRKKDTLDAMAKYFYKMQAIFPRDSYDFIVLMTGLRLVDNAGHFRGGPDIGISLPAADCGGMHDEEVFNEKIMNCAIVMHKGGFEDYFTAAREIAHMMFVADDDVQVELDDGRKMNCLSSQQGLSSGIMDPRNQRLPHCLLWSYCSTIQFNRYFSSKSHCCLLNYPRTRALHASRIVSQETQCQCYGLSALDQNARAIPVCTSSLKCMNKAAEIIAVTSRPLDGTPCAHRKYCWYHHCVEIPDV